MKRTSTWRVTSVAVVLALGLAAPATSSDAATPGDWSISFTGALEGAARRIEPACVAATDESGPLLVRASFRLDGRRLTLAAYFAPPLTPGVRAFAPTPDASGVVVGIDGTGADVATGTVGSAVVAGDRRSGTLRGTLTGPDGTSELEASFVCARPGTHAGSPSDGDETSSPADEAPSFSGTVEATVSGSACAGGENGEVHLFTLGRGEIFGGILASGSYTCEGITVPTSGAVLLEGRARGDRLFLHVIELDGLLLPTWNCLVGQRLTIPLRRGAGTANPAVDAPSGDRYECTIDVERV